MTRAGSCLSAGMGVAALLTLPGCDSTQAVKLDMARAKLACLQGAAIALGVKADDLDESDFTTANDMDTALRFVSTGQFVISLDHLRLKGVDRAVNVACTGDFNRRTISSLQIDGVIRRPEQPEDWVF